MSEQVITDRAEAMFLAPDEDGDSYTVVPITRLAPSPADPSGDRIDCPWCGSSSAPGPGCDACGSPLC
jgi:hypothetical protein